MAYETLKSIITQNIKTNGQESITGAILQQILLQMVDELGYTPEGDLATKEWVNTQLADYASKTWVTNQLGSYLPLTGGYITGNLEVGQRLSISAQGGSEEDPESFDFYLENGEIVVDYTVIDRFRVRANSIIKNGGTSSQVLCADGSVKTLAELKAALNAI